VLRAEITANAKAGTERKEIQSLPYLSAVVKEGLRVSMANPTRLPRVVPAGGWTFKSPHFPAGALVGCSELHFNENVFSNHMASSLKHGLREVLQPTPTSIGVHSALA